MKKLILIVLLVMPFVVFGQKGKISDKLSDNKFLVKVRVDYYDYPNKDTNSLGFFLDDTVQILGEKDSFSIVQKGNNIVYVKTSDFLPKDNFEISEDKEEKNINDGEAPKSSNYGSSEVRGHYRTSKKGKVYYVKPHTRKKN